MQAVPEIIIDIIIRGLPIIKAKYSFQDYTLLLKEYKIVIKRKPFNYIVSLSHVDIENPNNINLITEQTFGMQTRIPNIRKKFELKHSKCYVCHHIIVKRISEQDKDICEVCNHSSTINNTDTPCLICLEKDEKAVWMKLTCCNHFMHLKCYLNSLRIAHFFEPCFQCRNINYSYNQIKFIDGKTITYDYDKIEMSVLKLLSRAKHNIN